MSRSNWMLVGASLALFFLLPIDDAQAASRCAARKTQVAAKVAYMKAMCHARGMARGVATEDQCLARARAKLIRRMQRASRLRDCAEGASSEDVDAIIDDFLASLTAAFAPSTPTPALSGPTPSPTPRPRLCCASPSNGFGGAPTCSYQIEAFCRQVEAGGVLGQPGDVCDGASGACVPAPGTSGACCDLSATALAEVSACGAGPGVVESCNAYAPIGAVLVPNAVCTENGCVSP